MNMSPRNGSDATATVHRNGEASGRRIDALLEILPIGVYTIGPDRTVKQMNAEAARLTGVECRDAIGKVCRDVFHCSICVDACATDAARKGDEVQRNFPVDLVRPDGTQVSVQIDAAPLGGGDVAVTLRDVTEAERMRRTLRDRWVFHGMIGASPAFKQVVGQIRDAAPYDTPVLLCGESGTGKELCARAIHAESGRADRPFVVVSCSAYSESLLDSELFGHARGSLAGADRDRAGRLEAAEGGTVLLDEVGEMPPSVQARLMRVLDRHEVERAGEGRARPVDVRILAATTRDLQREVREGRFREDLYYRLSALTLRLPSLRERKEDVPALIDYLLRRAAMRTGKDVGSVAPDAMERLLAHTWPGNVRELENVLEGAVARSSEGVLRLDDLASDLGSKGGGAGGVDERMRDALRRAAGSVTLAARLLGVHRTTVWRWMCDAGVKREDFLPA